MSIMGEQVQWSDLAGWSGKMSQELSAVTEEKTLRQCSKKRSESSSRKPPLFLCLTKDGLQQDACPIWTENGALLGEYTMRSFGECPSEENVSRLSAILEDTPHPKYYLSAKACAGILRRAERRGKELEEPLKQVLIRQSQGASPQEQTEAPAPTEAPTSYAARIRGGCDGGGKGALVQTEKSGTLGTGNDQTIFAATPINLMVATRCKALGRGTGLGVGEPGDPANTISAAHSHGVFATAIPINDKATRWQGGGESRNHDGSGNGLGIGKDGDPSPTLTAGDRHSVICGNQMPLAYGIGNGQAHEAMTMAQEVSQTLNTMHDKQAILYQPKSAMEENWAESKIKNAIRAGESKVSHVVMCEDVSHTLRAKGNCAYREDAETYPVQNMIVRRLTPLECERLQGYPDGWTDIGEWIDSKGKKHKAADSPRYKALGNSIALPFWFWLLRRISAQYERPATLGSLFDGIGGFPLCWERCNGKGTALWASEIEEFPMAVTKMRFGQKEE